MSSYHLEAMRDVSGTVTTFIPPFIHTVFVRVLNTKTVPNVVPTKTCLPEGSNRTAVGADLERYHELRRGRTVFLAHLDLLYCPSSSLSSKTSMSS